MTILRWDKPAKVLTTAQWQGITADSAPPGVYTPNMSRSDEYTWRAKLIGGKFPRVEVRTSLTGTPRPHKNFPHGFTSTAQVLVIVEIRTSEPDALVSRTAWVPTGREQITAFAAQCEREQEGRYALVIYPDGTVTGSR
jgi:hypothetical protein